MMSVVAQYYSSQQADSVSSAQTKAVPAPSVSGAVATAGSASFQATLNTSQQRVAAAEIKAPPPQTAARPASAPTPTLEQLVAFARSHGWSEKQIALMKQLSLRKNSRTGQPWSALAQSAGSSEKRAAVGQVRDIAVGESSAAGQGIRGIRNNNPGNLEASETFQWQGQSGNDGRFATFTSPEHGIRALGMNLLSYHRRGLDTVSKIISRWAPPQDNNDTAAYIQKVSQALGVTAHTRLDVASPSVLSALSKAIIHHENGVIPFSGQIISSGVFSALGMQELPNPGQPVFKTAQAVAGQSHFALQTSRMDKKALTALRRTLSQQVQAAKVMLGSDGVATNVPGKAELVAAWGYTEGSRRFDELIKVMQRTASRKKDRA